jgi:hypothetical protein
MTLGKSGIPGCDLEFMDWLQTTLRNCVNTSFLNLYVFCDLTTNSACNVS